MTSEDRRLNSSDVVQDLITVLIYAHQAASGRRYRPLGTVGGDQDSVHVDVEITEPSGATHQIRIDVHAPRGQAAAPGENP